MKLAGVSALVLTAVSLTLPAARGQDAPPQPPKAAAIDIQIAVDTTGSMGPSIVQARRDAREIVQDTRRRLPGARFAIVDFKDQEDDPEYLVRQPMTADDQRVAQLAGVDADRHALLAAAVDDRGHAAGAAQAAVRARSLDLAAGHLKRCGVVRHDGGRI